MIVWPMSILRRVAWRRRLFARLRKRDRADCRSGAAQERAERAGFFSGGDHARQKRNQFAAKRLMKMIDKCAAQIFVIARSERGRDGARVAGSSRLQPTREILVGRIFRAADCSNFEIRNQENEI